MKLSTVVLILGVALVASLSSLTASNLPPKECSYEGLLPIYEQCLKAGKEGTIERSDCVQLKLNPKAESCVASFGDSEEDFHVGLANAVDFLGGEEHRPNAVMEFMTTWTMING